MTKLIAHHTLAALYMIACTFSFAIMTALVKGLKHYPTEQILFFRCFAALMFPLVYILLKRKYQVLKTNFLLLHILRCAFGISAMYCYFSGFVRLPLVEAHAFGRSKALFIALFAMLLLKEKLTKARIIAVLLGFFGILVMLNPGAPQISTGIVFVLCGAMFAALAMMCVSVLTRTEHPLTIVIYFMAFGSLLTFCFGYSHWKSMALPDLLLLCSTGFVGVLGQIFMVLAYKTADASYVGPFDYIELVWASLIGFLVWSELPTFLLVVGMVIVIGSQLYLHQQERKLTS